MSITQILKIIIEISKSKKLNDYITNSKNINIFQINFGLNIGWSIEGVMESSHKIDISYLGRTINKTNKLKDLSKIYKVGVVFE